MGLVWQNTVTQGRRPRTAVAAGAVAGTLTACFSVSYRHLLAPKQGKW